MKHSPSPVMNDEVHEDDDECTHQTSITPSMAGGNNDDDHANEGIAHCLSSIFPNTDDNWWSIVSTLRAQLVELFQ